jgi:hypothetical protein
MRRNREQRVPYFPCFNGNLGIDQAFNIPENAAINHDNSR